MIKRLASYIALRDTGFTLNNLTRNIVDTGAN